MLDRAQTQNTVCFSLVRYPEYWSDLSAIITREDFEDREDLLTLYIVCKEYYLSTDTPETDAIVAQLNEELKRTLAICMSTALAVSKESVLLLAQRLHNDTIRLRMAKEVLDIAFELNASDGLIRPFEEMVASLRNIVDTTIDEMRSDDNAKSLRECVIDYISYLQNGKTNYNSTGFSDLDNLVGGYYPGDFDVIAACSGGGKSDLAINFALNSARSGAKILYESLEMIGTEITERIVSREANILSSRLRDFSLDQQDWQNIAKASERLRDYPFIIDARPTLTVSQLECQINKHKPDIVIIDNLDLVKSQYRKSDRWREIEETCHSLKAMAKREHVCIVALNQLSRRVDSGGDDVTPRMADLYGGSAIEHDATWIIALTQKKEEAGIVTATVLKSRKGISKTYVKFAADFKYHRWATLAEDYE